MDVMKGHGVMRRCVLVVEPDASIAALLAAVLDEEGYAADCAASPQAARTLCAGRASADFCIALSVPCWSPHDAPFAWVDELRGLTGAAIILCTRDAAARYADYQAHGCAAIMEEPFDLQELADRVAALCDSSTAAVVPGETLRAEDDIFVLTTVDGLTHHHLSRAAAVLNASPPALTRHILAGVAPLLAEVADQAEKDGLPEDTYLYVRQARGDMLFGAEVRCPLTTRALRAHEAAVSAVAQARMLLERTTSTYAAARAATDTSRRRRVFGVAPLGQAPPL